MLLVVMDLLEGSERERVNLQSILELKNKPTTPVGCGASRKDFSLMVSLRGTSNRQLPAAPRSRERRSDFPKKGFLQSLIQVCSSQRLQNASETGRR